MRGHVEPERAHASRVVARALQRDAEGRAHQPLDEQVAGERAGERQEVEGEGIAPVQSEDHRRVHLLEALEAVEDRVVLQHQVVERHADRQRDHDRVDAVGAHRQPADQGAARNRDDQREGHHHPPGPAQAGGGAARAQHGDRVARDAGHRHLRERHHAAVAGEEGEGQRDQAEDQRLRGDLVEQEGRGDEGQQQHERQDQHVARPHRAPQGLDPVRCAAVEGWFGHARRPGPGGDPHGTDGPRRRRRARRAGVHRPAPARGAHAARPMMPRGLNARTAMRITKVKTTL